MARLFNAARRKKSKSRCTNLGLENYKGATPHPPAPRLRSKMIFPVSRAEVENKSDKNGVYGLRLKMEYALLSGCVGQR